MGRKASDYYTISLCQTHHGVQHAIGELQFQSTHGLNFHLLAFEFAKESPKARLIEKAREERADG